MPLLHERHPELTFDCTTKVEHVLEHAQVWEEMVASGCLFVVCALESVNDEILVRLDKGHTTAEAMRALDLLREHGLETRPSFMPFTPWTTPRDVLEIVEFVAAHDLAANVDPVQYTIRLLVPEGRPRLTEPWFCCGAHRGPVRSSHSVMTWSGGSPASAPYRSGKQPTRTPATVPAGTAAPISPSAKPRSNAH